MSWRRLELYVVLPFLLGVAFWHGLVYHHVLPDSVVRKPRPATAPAAPATTTSGIVVTESTESCSLIVAAKRAYFRPDPDGVCRWP